jgi:hypothetical protein
MYEIEGFDPTPFLQLAEVNNFLSFPAELLSLILDVSRYQQDMLAKRYISDPDDEMRTAASMMEKARLFDPLVWARRLQILTPCKDVEHRVRIASAHRAGVLLYISRTFPSNHPWSLTATDRRTLVAEIISNISQIDPESNFYKSIVWPCFIVGAESDDIDGRDWAIDRFKFVYGFIPWNYIVSCMDILQFIWSKKTNSAAEDSESELNWLHLIRTMENDHFIA